MRYAKNLSCVFSERHLSATFTLTFRPIYVVSLGICKLAAILLNFSGICNTISHRTYLLKNSGEWCLKYGGVYYQSPLPPIRTHRSYPRYTWGLIGGRGQGYVLMFWGLSQNGCISKIVAIWFSPGGFLYQLDINFCIQARKDKRSGRWSNKIWRPSTNFLFLDTVSWQNLPSLPHWKWSFNSRLVA